MISEVIVAGDRTNRGRGRWNSGQWLKEAVLNKIASHEKYHKLFQNIF
jgi:hypothetical protein